MTLKPARGTAIIFTLLLAFTQAPEPQKKHGVIGVVFYATAIGVSGNGYDEVKGLGGSAQMPQAATFIAWLIRGG
jgi:hypothetical protein